MLHISRLPEPHPAPVAPQPLSCAEPLVTPNCTKQRGVTPAPCPKPLADTNLGHFSPKGKFWGHEAGRERLSGDVPGNRPGAAQGLGAAADSCQEQGEQRGPHHEITPSSQTAATPTGTATLLHGALTGSVPAPLLIPGLWLQASNPTCSTSLNNRPMKAKQPTAAAEHTCGQDTPAGAHGLSLCLDKRCWASGTADGDGAWHHGAAIPLPAAQPRARAATGSLSPCQQRPQPSCPRSCLHVSCADNSSSSRCQSLPQRPCISSRTAP